MRRSLLFSVLICAGLVTAQRPVADTLITAKGPLVIQPVYHASVVLTWNDLVIYVDPYGGAKAYEGLAAPDLVLITDIHQDHLDTTTLRSVETSGAIFIVPQAVKDMLPEDLQLRSVVLGNGEKTKQAGLKISAIPMYNLPEEADSRHVKGRGNGYVLNLAGTEVYFSGDTEDITEMRELKQIDVAFVCMNLPYTMDVSQAASAVLDFKPVIVYPNHYRGKDGFSDVNEFKRLVNESNEDIDVRVREWYTKYE